MNKPNDHLPQFWFWLCLTASLVGGAIILSPFLDFQAMLSQGDHGRDLYAFEQTAHGQRPYLDYWWVYGPLMPYIYAPVLSVLGISIKNVLLVKMFFNLCSGIFIFLTLTALRSPWLGLIGSLWFWAFNPDFFYTYNNAAGITLLAATLYCLTQHILTQRGAFIWAGLGAIFLLGLVKINIGLATLAGFGAMVIVTNLVHRRPIKEWLPPLFIGGFALLACTAAIYIWCVRGLSIMEIRQCFPYVKGDQPYSVTPWQALSMFADFTKQNILFTLTNKITAVLLVLAIIQSIYQLTTIKTPSTTKRTFGLFLGGLVLLIILNFHEFLVSGVFYRHFWIKPFQLTLIVSLIAFAVINLPRWIAGALLVGALSVVINNHQANLNELAKIRNPQQFLTNSRLQIYTTNHPSWAQTVNLTTDYLQKNLTRDELFFALPYDCLYYYLTGKKTPTRQLIFFDHIKIPPEQERSVISELEKNKVNWVLASSRMNATQEPGLGVLGKTYCPLIGKYLEDNFAPVAQFGDWQNEPGWAWNHGTVILKRRNFLN